MFKIIQLTELTPKDMQELVEYERAVFGAAGLDEWVLGYLVRWGRVFALADNNKTIGLAELIRAWDNPEVAYFIGFSIISERQNQGLGDYFLRSVMKILQKEEFRRVQLTVSEDNKTALSLYRNQGFEELDFVKDIYGKGEDRLVLGKKL